MIQIISANSAFTNSELEKVFLKRNHPRKALTISTSFTHREKAITIQNSLFFFSYYFKKKKSVPGTTQYDNYSKESDKHLKLKAI